MTEALKILEDDVIIHLWFTSPVAAPASLIIHVVSYSFKTLILYLLIAFFVTALNTSNLASKTLFIFIFILLSLTKPDFLSQARFS